MECEVVGSNLPTLTLTLTLTLALCQAHDDDRSRIDIFKATSLTVHANIRMNHSCRRYQIHKCDHYCPSIISKWQPRPNPNPSPNKLRKQDDFTVIQLVFCNTLVPIVAPVPFQASIPSPL